MGDLDQHVVFITGAARGIGRQTAKTVVRRGGRVVLVDVDEDELASAADELGHNAAHAVADVTDLDSMTKAVEVGIERFGKIDVVVANAGIASYGSVLNTDPAAFRRVIDVNLVGVFHTVRAALPSLIEHHGYILIVSSQGAFTPAPGLAAYNASKAGVEIFANALRLEVHHHGVGVGSAHMSWIDTPMFQDTKNDLSAFTDMLNRLPRPLNKTTTSDKCAAAFVHAIENRSRRVYVPRWVRVVAWVRNIISSPIGERQSLKMAPEILPRMDAEMAALGRSISKRFHQVPTGD